MRISLFEMHSALCILLFLVNYSITATENAKNIRKGVYDRMDVNIECNKWPKSSLADPNALYLTPYIEAGLIEEAISDSRVNEPFASYESFSGFLTINSASNANLFVWFFPCVKNGTTNASLIVWLESNPTCPSSCRVFDTTGPYKRGEGRMRKNAYTLLEDFHVLYIDSPVGAGFSFVHSPEGYSKTFYDAGKDVAEAVKQFAQIFERYTQNGIYINGGDTYSSKIAIYSAWHLHNVDNSSPIPVKGVMIGNALLDPINMVGVSDLLYHIGVADKFTRDYLRSMEEEIKRSLRSYQQMKAFEQFQIVMSKVHELGYEQVDDFTTMTVADGSDNSKISHVFSRVRIKEALHVGGVSYNDGQLPLCYLQHDFFTTMSGIISELVPRIKFLFYVGQYGIKVNAAKTYDFLRHLTWPGALAFHQLSFGNWCLDGKIVGYRKTYSNLTYFVMRNVGNANQLVDPALMISLWERFTGFDEENESIQSLVAC